MDEAVSAADANRKFSALLRRVRDGHSYVVTSHGKPVARIVPVGQDESAAEAARAVLMARLAKAPIVDIGTWSRDELYDD